MSLAFPKKYTVKVKCINEQFLPEYVNWEVSKSAIFEAHTDDFHSFLVELDLGQVCAIDGRAQFMKAFEIVEGVSIDIPYDFISSQSRSEIYREYRNRDIISDVKTYLEQDTDFDGNWEDLPQEIRYGIVFAISDRNCGQDYWEDVQNAVDTAIKNLQSGHEL